MLAESEPSLFALVEAWLERTPFLSLGGFSWWTHYRQAFEAVQTRDRAEVTRRAEAEVRCGAKNNTETRRAVE